MKNKQIICSVIIGVIIIATAIVLVLFNTHLNSVETSNNKTIPAPTLAKLYVENNNNTATYSVISNPLSWQYTDGTITDALFASIDEQLSEFKAIDIDSNSKLYLAIDEKYNGTNYSITSCELKTMLPDQASLTISQNNQLEISDNKIFIPLIEKSQNYYELTVEFERGTILYLFKLNITD